MIMYCRHCHAKLIKNARFCMGCSMPVEDPLESLDGVTNKFGNLSIERTEKTDDDDDEIMVFDSLSNLVEDDSRTINNISKKGFKYLFNFRKKKN